MQIVNVFSDDYKANEYQMTLLVNHINKKRRFGRAWVSAVALAKKDDPEGWTLDEVFETLDKAGWQVIRVNDSVEVSY